MLHIERFVFNPFQENTFVVHDDTKECVIIDCGAFFKEERKAIVDYIVKNELKPIHLLATHAHIDHNFGNNTIYENFGLMPEVAAKDEPLMSNLKRQSEEYINYSLDYDMPPVKAYFSDGDAISFGNHTFEVIATPGHSPGSSLFYCQEENLAFSGDTLFRMSVGRTDLTLGSHAELMTSLRRMADTLPHDTLIIPGHGPQTTLGDEIRTNPYFGV